MAFLIRYFCAAALFSRNAAFEEYRTDVKVSVEVDSQENTVNSYTMTNPETSSATAASTASASIPISTQSPIDWQPCSWGQELNAQCANISVPLDYSNVNTKRDDSNNLMDLPLIRFPAISSNPLNKSILFNPGGPGVSAIVSLYGLKPTFANIYGQDYDFVAFDPRGVNNNLKFNCYSEVDDIADTDANIDGILNNLANFSMESITQAHNASQKQGVECKQQQPEIGTLMGTAYVSRDMLQAVEALNEDGLLRYLGFSYGTILGDTFAAMFPDRVDRLILDGNVPPLNYYHASTDAMWYQDIAAVVSGFFNGCASYPDNCGIKDAANRSGSRLLQEYVTFMNQVESGEIVVNEPLDNTTQAKLIDLESDLEQTLYDPGTWQNYSNTIQSVYDAAQPGTKDSTPKRRGSSQKRSSRRRRHLDDTNNVSREVPILCGETGLFTNGTSNVLDIEAAYWQYELISGPLAPYTLIGNYLNCAGWLMRAKEIYAGDFRVKTRSPILFFGSPYDPVTSYESAVQASNLFDGSVLVKHMGYGHTSIAQISTCSLTYQREYMRNGTLPPPGTVCDPDFPVFSGQTPYDLATSSPFRRAVTEDLTVAGFQLQQKWSEFWKESKRSQRRG